MAENRTKNYADKGDAIKGILYKYLAKWHWFALSLIITFTAALLYLRYTPKLYLSEAKISVLNQNKGIDFTANLFSKSSVNLDKEMRIIKSYPIIEQVVLNQDLTVSYFNEGKVLTTELNSLPIDFVKTIDNKNISYASYRIEITEKGFIIYEGVSEKGLSFPNFTTLNVKHSLPFELNPNQYEVNEKYFGQVYLVNFVPVSAATRGLMGSILVSSLGESTGMLSLKHVSQNKQKNERILNELIEVYNQDGINDRQLGSLRTLQFIDARFESLSGELDSLETDIKEFKQDNQIVSIEAQASSGVSKLSAAQEQYFQLENQLLLLDLMEEILRSSKSELDLLPTNMISGESVNGLVTSYNELVLEAMKYGVSAGSNNPQLVTLKNNLSDLKSNIFASIEANRAQLEATKAKLDTKNRGINAEIFSIPEKEKSFLTIKRQQEIKQELYIYLLQKREEAAVTYAITEPTIKVVENALSFGGAISPNTNSIYTRAILAGFGIPFAILYLIFILDTKLKDRSNIEQVTSDIPIISELPKNKKKNDLLFLSPNDNSNHAEAFRIMSYNLNYILPSKNNDMGKVLYVSSSIKGEGKTYVSVNLSLAFSSLNKKVLLIGGDLRNPQIHSYLGRDKNVEGLSNYLYDTDFDWRKALVKGFERHPNHDILFSGTIPPNPANLLTNGRLDKLLEEAKLEYDFIIVDNAPTILVTDTMLTSYLADANVYVTRADYTEKKLIYYAKELSDTGKLKNMVFVVNALDKKYSGYGYKYGYNYGYGYGYGAMDSKGKKVI